MFPAPRRRRADRVDREVADLFDRVYEPLVRALRAAGHVDADDAVQSPS
jgi:hypothetical protein